MAKYIRRVVSGDRARFKDAKLKLELDLVYLTDQIIIMGYPATGIESWYRNRREDAKRFLEDRHGKNYWVFNFCPVHENSYDAELFEGRVSRFPFPDHHAPPLSMIPLVTREIRQWLNGPSERVAVLHCKAGKGRSGTMACAYLLSLRDASFCPQSSFRGTLDQEAGDQVEETMDFVDNVLDSQKVDSSESSKGQTVPSVLPASTVALPRELQDILDFHTSRRMKARPSPGKKQHAAVSIPSQRRFLRYWSTLLARESPAHDWPAIMPDRDTSAVRLTKVTLRMRETSSAARSLVRAASVVLRGVKDNAVRSSNLIWASLARYDDDFVGLLDKCERQTMDKRHVGRKSSGPDDQEDRELAFLKNDRWDKGKMVTCFASLGVAEEVKKDGVITYSLCPLSGERWNTLQNEIVHYKKEPRVVHGGANSNVSEAGDPISEINSVDKFVSDSVSSRSQGIILPLDREVRIKLYMGQVFLGWFWIIPAFHIHASESTIKILLRRDEIDFPLGVGSSIIDVEIEMERLMVGEGINSAEGTRIFDTGVVHL